MQFSDVAPGMSRESESASWHNAVNFLLRQSKTLSEEKNFLPPGAITFYNISTQEIPAFTAVAVTGEFDSGDPQALFRRFDGMLPASGIPALDGELPWGIALEKVAPGQSGMMVLYGLVPGFFSGTGKRVGPGTDGLAAGESGTGEVIFPCVHNNGKTYPGLLLLGSAAPAANVVPDDYNGYFKLYSLSSNSAAIVCGSQPDAENCGFTDVPGAENIPRTVMNFTEPGRKQIYLLFFYDRETKKYSFRFDTFIAEDAVFYLYLGYFQNGTVTQSYRSNKNREEFGESWYLK